MDQGSWSALSSMHGLVSFSQAVPAECLQVFTEAEVRASVVFQLSKLVTMLLKASRLCVGGAEWDAMVAGVPILFQFSSCAPLS